MSDKKPSQENLDMAAMFKHMAEYGGGPASAFQMDLGKAENGEPFVFFTVGLTKRDRFAMAAMQGLLAAGENSAATAQLSNEAVALADALLERLKA